MKTNEAADPILDILATLTPAAPPRACDERIRSRCHQALARRRPSRPRPAPAATCMERLLTTTLTLTAAIYAAAAVIEGLRLIPDP